MKFRTLTVASSLGWRLAHSIATKDGRIAKSSEITPEIIAELDQAGQPEVLAYRLEEGDTDENSAARMVADHIQGQDVDVQDAAHGRCNLYAAAAGVLVVDDEINDLNSAVQEIGIATLDRFTPVTEGQLLATVKIVPYGIETAQLHKALKMSASLKVAPYQSFRAALLSTGTPLNDKPLRATKNRIEYLKGTLETVETCAHDTQIVAAEIRKLSARKLDLLIVSGISAISDMQDILPSALQKAGGSVLHLGMPVDPGNLLMLGKIGSTVVIGMPGCAKSTSRNGFDWVLERFAANLPLDASTLQNMGIGGLLKEATNRPEPRAPAASAKHEPTRVVLLAAGKSSRSGNIHKLLAMLDSKPVVTQSVTALKKAGLAEITVVTGSRASEVEAALSSQNVSFLYNEDFESGMGGSLSLGISALPESTELCLVSLGDMPFVNISTIHALQETACQVSEADIFIPLFNGKRGNPVLWRRAQFDKLKHLRGDQGGRAIIRSHENLVCEVPVDDPGILIDLDTPEALAQFGISVTS